MKISLHIAATANEVLTELAAYFIQQAHQSVVQYGRFNVALSGGSSPKKLYELLSSPQYRDKVDWSRIYFFFGDERYVPQTHPDSNYLMAKRALFDPLNIEPDHIFAVDTSLPPASAALNYMNLINDHFAETSVRFNLILLGLGDNAHTASLFPYTDILQEKSATVKEVFLQDQQVYRITLTAPLINDAHHIAFLVYGESKAEAVHHILKDPMDIASYPAQLINPVNGNVEWFIDQAAAQKII